MTHARRSDPGAEKLSAKRSNVYDLSNHFWQRKFHHRAALYLKSLFDRIWNRLELKLNPKLGQGYPNLFEHSQNLNLGFFGFRFFRSSQVKSGQYGVHTTDHLGISQKLVSGPIVNGIITMHRLSVMMFKSEW